MINSWVDFYMEFADKLLEFKLNRKKLIKKLQKVCDNAGVNFPKLDNAHVDIDPFTVIGMFNKHISYDNYISFLNSLSIEFQIKADIPDDYAGPRLIPLSAMYFDIENRGKSDINNLWDFFEAALKYADKPTAPARNDFIRLYDIVIQQRKVKWNLTMGLYWCRPYKYLSLDSTNRDYINETEMTEDFINTPPGGEEYLKIVDEIQNEISQSGEFEDFVDFTAKTWERSRDDGCNDFVFSDNQIIAKNTILYGPPGTGKTYNTALYAVAIIENKALDVIKEEDKSEVLERFNAYKAEGRIEFTTFHQSYGYEEFIEGIKPVTLDDSNIGYEVQPGVFKSFCDKSDDDRNYVYIIDEINRGNISKIFGELITLVEDNKRLGCTEECTVRLPYSKQFFGIPNNLYILGTMNTADRSITALDTALRRRFDFKEIIPNSGLLDELVVDGISISIMLEVINQRISVLYDREHTIGHAYFWSLFEDNSLKNLADIFEKKIIPLLQEYFYDNYKNIRLVLGDNQKPNKQDQFILEHEVDIPDLFGDADVGDSVTYEINPEALYNPEAYIGIYKAIFKGIFEN